ncbi:class II SORL domain-containing protein [Candidatus Magnetominusculus xianensis]|uniref:Superoxide reductase n=1 Tax=Candidatus Magnetominusculus xianensis TaxID=1748249 RepID=A0ABR5SCB3_9BACT|nr:class II SORL domain-containing protein [Candidatus Magnetominusculus xianensis]KWT79627.1 putative superoxide reductase [Candidatus Magnetominusculus xianensis]MBF0403841.1 class II SORL domain-containing protein [Nitrospirota bacterium]
MSEKSLFCGMNKPAEPGNLTETEKKHMPVIDCPDTVKAGEPFKVNIKVGEIPHVMQEAHSVQWIEVFSGENFKVRIDLTPVTTLPDVTVTLVKSGKHRTSTIRVVERCNLHGQWEAVKQITITE